MRDGTRLLYARLILFRELDTGMVSGQSHCLHVLRTRRREFANTKLFCDDRLFLAEIYFCMAVGMRKQKCWVTFFVLFCHSSLLSIKKEREREHFFINEDDNSLSNVLHHVVLAPTRKNNLSNNKIILKRNSPNTQRQRKEREEKKNVFGRWINIW